MHNSFNIKIHKDVDHHHHSPEPKGRVQVNSRTFLPNWNRQILQGGPFHPFTRGSFPWFGVD